MIGCIADDYTGGTDVAAALRRSGLRTVLLFGTGGLARPLPECDAVVVALKSRTIPAADAVAVSLRVRAWLVARGVTTLYFKYCSTFDSTDEGNIGPVTDALLDAAGESMTLICPASPEHGRTVYSGHLFVGGSLLSDSPMRHHPLTPMTDSDLVRLLSRQTPHRVGLLPLQAVRAGAGAVARRLRDLARDGVRHVVVDAIEDTDLEVVAAATDLPVITGGAGLAGALRQDRHADSVPLPAGPSIVLAGSCSAATLAQVAHAREVFPSWRLDPVATPDPARLLADARAWLAAQPADATALIYSSAPADQRAPGAADLLEHALGELARDAVARGAHRVVVAGGETSGAVVAALGIDSVIVAAEEDRGVPWCVTPDLALLLKSGNFGQPDLLVRATKADK